MRPGNRAVVHHILVFDRKRGGAFARDFEGGVQGYLAGYVPGLRTAEYPDGMAKRIEAGSTLIFQVHYTPIGTEQFDLSDIGFLWADPEAIEREVRTVSVAQRRLNIPPHDDDYRTQSTSRRPLEDALVLSFMPHMHLRGKAFRYDAILPDGERRTLLDIPAYDFNWQTAYRLAEPLALPNGTRIAAEAAFDNSEENLANPDPTATVRWGDQTWEEMMIGYFDVSVPLVDREAAAAEAAARRKEKVDALIARLDRNGDGEIDADETPTKYRFMVRMLDRDDSGAVDATELERVIDRLPLNR